MKVVFSRRADRDVDRVDAWWRQNRPYAPELFEHELADAVSRLETPGVMLGTERRGRWGTVLGRAGADCRPVARADAHSGSVQLDGPTVSDRAPVRGKLELHLAGGSLRGSFEATYCPQSETEARGCE